MRRHLFPRIPFFLFPLLYFSLFVIHPFVTVLLDAVRGAPALVLVYLSDGALYDPVIVGIPVESLPNREPSI